MLGIWWKRANTAGAVAGIVGGLLAGTAYLYYVRFAGGEPWLGLDHLRFGVVGMTVSLLLTVGVSLLTAPPDEETQRMVDQIRIPRGGTVLAAKH